MIKKYWEIQDEGYSQLLFGRGGLKATALRFTPHYIHALAYFRKYFKLGVDYQ